MKSHLVGLRGGLADEPSIDPAYQQTVSPVRSKPLCPTHEAKRREFLAHPVHGVKAIEAKARETIAQAFDGDPHGPRWALTVFTLALDGNPKAIASVGEALAIYSAHFSKPAPKDDASPFGIPRPGGVA